jgi:pimeloyl-ACP methyl ester carboxylesterase
MWSWQRQLPDWSRQFRCIAVENRGTGRSPKPPGPYSIEEMADDAAEALAGSRAHVAGFSMGGYIAQMLAVRHPELVDRLVLICTATGGPGIRRTPPETTAVWQANAGRTPQEFARATMPLSFRPGWTDAHPDEFESLLADRLEYPTSPECWRAQYDACLDWPLASRRWSRSRRRRSSCTATQTGSSRTRTASSWLDGFRTPASNGSPAQAICSSSSHWTGSTRWFPRS